MIVMAGLIGLIGASAVRGSRATEYGLTYLMPRGEAGGIGYEKGVFRKNGISRFEDPFGSFRYVYAEHGVILGALQVMARRGIPARVANVIVRPEHQRRGIASKLFARALKDFKVVEHAPEAARSPAGKAWISKLQRGSRKLELIAGGLASGRRPEEFDQVQLAAGTKVESEHTDDWRVAQEIAMDHLVEDSAYYLKLSKIESGSRIRTAFKSKVPRPRTKEDLRYIEKARKEYQDEGRIEIDDSARVSKGADNGAHVEAWVWVYDR
jgi:GNAT superfamily N-acetyltransferase